MSKIYDLMDWAAIDGIIYSEDDNPHGVLGPHVTENGLVIQAFVPDASQIWVKLKNNEKQYPMEMQHEDGFFALLFPRKSIPEYTYIIEDKEGKTREIYDPYFFPTVITQKEAEKFNRGIHHEIYEKMGAHEMTLKGVEGVLFAVWAPFALRVSVVGDFNHWDGRAHQMRRLWNSGIFELFIPEVKVGDLYKYEIKFQSGLPGLKSDPYANETQLRPETASVVTNLEGFKWTDEKWLSGRKKRKSDIEPMSVYELHLGSWRKPEDGREFYNYKELAPMIADYVKEMGYTHIELMPVMEHPLDASWGYQVTGYYAPTSRYGSPKDFMYFINHMHKEGIGVILDWVPAHFPKDIFGLASFDGTCLYEHLDPRQGMHPHWGTLIYNYGRPEVRNFLIANAIFWVKKYHVDGIRMDAVASMLYLDYGKQGGDWVANIYGGNENLEAIKFLKQLSDTFKGQTDGALLIAEESTAWPKVTGDTKEDGLGFDYKWNMGWMNDFLGYMRYDPYFRTHHYGELIFSMIYAYSEKFLLAFSHDEVVHGKGSMIGKMPGERANQFANLRVAYGFMYTHPGKKLLFMGQDIGQYEEWSEERSLNWAIQNETEHSALQSYVRDLNRLYKKQSALYELDYEAEGFEWINNMSAKENIIVFTRNTKDANDFLLIVCNFVPIVQENYKIGVPFEGKYKEIFSSDRAEYGGADHVNKRVKQSKVEECDGRDNSIRITVPPLGISIFQYSKTKEKAKPGTKAKAKKKETKSSANLKEELAKKVRIAEENAELEKSLLAAEQVKEAQEIRAKGKER
ncbi:1,4-alpha-glucan branching protein GlgB [Konateibacter massiliensis]|uniref:1,4-alpha-glucan branching protein GlgB n=1 Tax=Konateibacter massiliensis TaxID=2002841 RepID=UPI000C15F0A3|nr:1,4-alpha-glucan branching protein GlgB [Konateibacter massiliensis]